MTAVNWGRVSRPAFAAAGDAAVWRDDGQPRRYSTFSRHAPLAAPLAHCTRLLLRYARDRVKYPRGTRLAMGNALVARMATTALRKGMSLRLNVNVLTLCEAQGAVRGVEIEYQGQERRCTPDAGWCWPQAGFAAGALAARYRPHTREHFTMSPPANDGAALHLAAALNAREGTDRASNFFWAPVSVLTRADGSEERFPIW